MGMTSADYGGNKSLDSHEELVAQVATVIHVRKCIATEFIDRDVAEAILDLPRIKDALKAIEILEVLQRVSALTDRLEEEK